MFSATLKQQIEQCLALKTGLKHWSFSDTRIQTREGEIVQAVHKDLEHAVAIKRYYQKARVVEKQASLQYYNEQMGDPQAMYQVPKFYGCIAEEGLILMEWVAAATLKRQLWQRFYQRGFQQKRMKQSLCWLKHFHQQSFLKPMPIKPLHYSMVLQSLLKSHQGYGHSLCISKPHFQRAVDCIEAIYPEFDDLLVLHSQTHGDFSPTNILLTDERVVGIDFFSRTAAPVADDVARMLAHISIGYPNMITRGDMRATRAYRQWPLVELILDTYQYPTDAQQQRFFLFVFLYQLVRRWLLTAGKMNGLMPQTSMYWQDRLLNRWILFKSEQISQQVTQLLAK